MTAPLLLLASTAEVGQVEQIARTFGVDWPHFGAQLLSFSIVCAVLYQFAYKSILAMLEQRREQIAQGLANAEQIKAELARTEAQRAEVIAAANVEANRLIEEARAAAARVQQEETRKAVAAGRTSFGGRGRPRPRIVRACWPSSRPRSGVWSSRPPPP